MPVAATYVAVRVSSDQEECVRMTPEQTSRLNRWGVAGILSLLASIPISEALAAVIGERSTASIVPAFILLLLSMTFGIVAASRGRRWWLIVTFRAAVLAFLAVLGMIRE
jgi:hypothetical protein